MNKLSFVLKKILLYCSLLLAIISINFALLNLLPGDPLEYYLGENAYYSLLEYHPEDIPAIREKYGLDLPLSQQYVQYLKSMITFDFGKSYSNGEDISSLILFRLKWTLILTLPAIVISAIAGLLLGSVAGYNHGKPLDNILTPLMTILNGIPTHCMAIIIVIFFAAFPGILPLSGMTSGGLSGFAKVLDVAKHMILPGSTITLFRTSHNYLFVRQTTMSLKSENFVATAFTKGLKPSRLIFHHILPNIILPYITMICMQFGGAISGSLLIENVFSWKGMGTLIRKSVETLDYPTIYACLFLLSICVVVANIVADILCVVFDPRANEEKEAAA